MAGSFGGAIAQGFRASGSPRPMVAPKPVSFGKSQRATAGPIRTAQNLAQAFAPVKPLAPHPTTPQASGGASVAAPAATGATDSSGSPLDATALNNIATNLFKVNNSIGADQLSENTDLTNLQGTLGSLGYAYNPDGTISTTGGGQLPLQQLALEQKYNNNGGLYSSVYNQAQGNLLQTDMGKATADVNKYAGQVNGLNAKIAGLQGEVPFYNLAQALASAGAESKVAAASPAPSTPSTTTGGGGSTAAGLAQATRAAAGRAQLPAQKPKAPAARPQPAKKSGGSALAKQMAYGKKGK